MADIQDIFDQYIGQAELLLQEGKLKDAYMLCQKVLDADPENSAAQAMREKVADAAQSYNQKSIDEKIKSLEPLWKDGEYAEIIKSLTELSRYAPHYAPLEQALVDAQDLYRRQLATQEKNTAINYKEQLQALFAGNKVDEMIPLMVTKNREALTNPEIAEINSFYRDKIIEQKINEHQALFISEKYDDIVNYLYQLQQIDRQNDRIKALLLKHRKNLLVSQVSNKQEFTIRATENMNTLYQIGKYEKAQQVAEEILHFDPRDKLAKAMAIKAKAKYAKQLQDETENQIATSYQEMKTLLAQDKSKAAGFKSL